MYVCHFGSFGKYISGVKFIELNVPRDILD